MLADQVNWLTIALHRPTSIAAACQSNKKSISLYSAPSVTRAICYTEHRPVIRKETQEACSSRMFHQATSMPLNPSHTAARVLLALMQTPPPLRPGYFPGLGARNPISKRTTSCLQTCVWTRGLYGQTSTPISWPLVPIPASPRVVPIPVTNTPLPGASERHGTFSQAQGRTKVSSLALICACKC